mmetsp:Transcript_8392/g.23482  ORF Transcript_8392/g.23482 Transcript_8392/m.23482 type:complete len:209 (+) Transcript_8392:222-848(+)
MHSPSIYLFAHYIDTRPVLRHGTMHERNRELRAAMTDPTPPPSPPLPPFAVLQEGLPCSGDGSILAECLSFFDTPTIITTLLLGGPDDGVWSQAVSFMDPFTLGALEMTCRHALRGGWTPEGRWGEMDDELFKIGKPRGLGDWTTKASLPFSLAAGTRGSPGGGLAEVISRVGGTENGRPNDTCRTRVIRCSCTRTAGSVPIAPVCAL